MFNVKQYLQKMLGNFNNVGERVRVFPFPCNNISNYGDFINLQDDGKTLGKQRNKGKRDINLAETAKNLTQMLATKEIFRKFAISLSDFRVIKLTLMEKVICITLPFDTRKSGKFDCIGRMRRSDAHVYRRGLLLLICRYGFCQNLRERIGQKSAHAFLDNSNGLFELNNY